MQRRRTRRTMRSWIGSVALGAAVAGTLAVPPPAAFASEAGTGSQAEADRATYLGRSHYTGEIHAHTSMSDGALLPTDAYTHVREQTDADFFALAEHDVMWDLRNGDDFIEDWRDAESDEWRAQHEAVEAFNAEQDELVVVPSVENTWYDGTGHLNVYNADWHATVRATEQGSVDGFANLFGTGDLKYDYYTLLARLKLDPEAIGQFNHPSPTAKGNFFGFKGLDPVADDRMELIEVKSAGHFAQYVSALDAGWHLAPTWSGDEHSATWVSGNEAITGIWAQEHSPEGLYAAMQDRSLYSTQDVDAVMAFGGDDQIMGSILPADAGTVDFEVSLDDPGAGESFASVRLLTNGGEVAHDFGAVTGNAVDLQVERTVSDGDYYFVRADQADGDFLVSAPIWVGETTRGANYAPEIDLGADVPTTATYGQTVALPVVRATDDSGVPPTVDIEVYDSAGLVPVQDGAFRVRSYDDHFIVVKATDGTANTNAELIRVTIDHEVLDPAGVFRHFGTTVSVAEEPGGAGLAVTTDRSIEKVYAQVVPAGSTAWAQAEVLTSTNDRAYEVNAIGNDEPEYQHSITGQTLRSHEFDLTGLTPGARYQYRLGVAVAGAAPEPQDTTAWTGVEGAFLAGGGAEPVYLLGDLQVQSHDPADLGMLRGVLEQLRTQQPGGGTAVQVGDLVDNGGRGQYWTEVQEHALDGLDLQLAPMVGNHETYGDLDYDAVTGERSAIFSNVYNLPDNGAIGESNYSFDRGPVHFSVLNSNLDLAEQLDWLIEDVRASEATWHVVLGHFSYYGGSHADDAGMDLDRDRVTAVLDQLGVDLYVGGHDHVYKRSTVFEGRLARTPEEEAAGTTFVTMGSSGPKFYDNSEFWWDDVVFDEKTQVGGVLEVTEAGLELSAYTIDGRVVDRYTITKPRGSWKLSSARVQDRELDGVGFLSHPGSRETVTVTAATYDNSREQVIALRSEEVRLAQTGREQFVAFDTPLPVQPSDTVRLFVWDSLANGKPLRPAVTLQEGLAGNGTETDPYLIDSADDLSKVDNDPAGYYRLTTDLEVPGEGRTQLGRAVAFTGVFDGAGHTISGLGALPNQGPGLFADNGGTIRDLVVRGDVTTERATAGLVADVNHGLIERVRVEGSVSASGSTGGIVGEHFGVLRDSHSDADVHVTGAYSGGAVGLARSGSVTEDVLVTGAVTAGARNAGGVVSYGYDETVVHSVVALNRNISAPSYAHAIVGRVYTGHRADLADNYVSRLVPIAGQSLNEPPAADNLKGEVVPAATIQTQAFYEARGWDFDAVWAWSEAGKRPVLRMSPEEVAPPETPDLPADARGFYVVDTVDDLRQIGEHPAYDYVLAADLDLTGIAFTSLPGAFVGELDGAGHTITGLTSTGGLFAQISGHVHDLAVVDATVTSPAARAGILANASTGTVERVYTTGSVTAPSRAGGLVGDSSGIVRDAYSTATVRSENTEAGGLIGVALAGSVTERVYAAGPVSAGVRNIGGVAGYGYTGTEIRGSVALNPTVQAPAWAHRFLGRVLAGQVATLADNWAAESVAAAEQADAATGPSTLNGATATTAQVRSSAFFTDRLGWDLTSVWAWDEDGKRPVLRAVTEDAPPAEDPVEPGPALERDRDGAYLLTTAADLLELAAYPGERFRLAADLDLTGVGPVTPAFTGELDGAGHTLRGYSSTEGGLFTSVSGSVHDLLLADASVETSKQNVGLLADRNDGTLERVATTGVIRGAATVGGLVGYSCGTIRDAWSSADVTAAAGRQAGGLVGIAGGATQCASTGGSLTERTYAAGSVEVVGNQNAGGLAGYSYNGTTLRQSIALNPLVKGTAYAHRVVARTLSGHTPALVDNYASDAVVADVQSVPATGPASLNGATIAAAQAGDEATYTGVLGWDLATVWTWDSALRRPLLRGQAAPTDGGGQAEAPVERAAVAYRAAPFAAVAPVGIIHETSAGEDGTTLLALDAGPGEAGAQVSVMVLEKGADATAPAPDAVVFLEQVTLDETGRAQLTMRLPGAPSSYLLAANTSGDAPRLVAPLTAGSDPGDPPTGPPTVPTGPQTDVPAPPAEPRAVRVKVKAKPAWVRAEGFARLVLRVRGIDGQPVAGRLVVRTPGERPVRRTVTDGRTVLKVPAPDRRGNVRVRVRLTGDGLAPVREHVVLRVR